MDFYRINEDYNTFLQNYEKEHRGITKVPNIRYSERNKFSFGTVLIINKIKYYVPVSSFIIKQEANILIRVLGDKEEVKGSLRFNYMIPVPDECVAKLVIKDEPDDNYRALLNKEYFFCRNNENVIKKKAKQIYQKVIHNINQKLTDNSCDFALLEKGYNEFINKYIARTS